MTDPCIRIRRELVAIEQFTALAPLWLQARGAPATPPDPTGTRHTNDGLVALLVLMAGGSTRPHPDPGDIDSVIGVLQRWDNDWRSRHVFGEPTDLPATVGRCAGYLRQRLDRARSVLDPFVFAEFASDIHKLHTDLERAFKAGDQHSEAPCPYCETWTLIRVPPRADGRIVEFRCTACHREYSAEDGTWWEVVRAYGAPV